MKPILLSPAELDDRSKYPSWCALGWFKNYRHLPGGSCEVHYHDLPEVYLWHEGKARALIDNLPVDMTPGVMAYTAAGAEHSYVAEGMYSNTGLMPKPFPGCRGGHLHRQETGESPVPKVPSFVVPQESNPFAALKELPPHCFARHISCGRFTNVQTILGRTTQSWLALLVREGKIGVRADGEFTVVETGHLFMAPFHTGLEVTSIGNSEVALAEGWPPELHDNRSSTGNERNPA